MVLKVVFQIPFDQSKWGGTWAKDLRTETPGDPHGPHIKIYGNQKDAETGERMTFIRCKHKDLEILKQYVNKVMKKIPEVLSYKERLQGEKGKNY